MDDYGTVPFRYVCQRETMISSVVDFGVDTASSVCDECAAAVHEDCSICTACVRLNLKNK